MSTRSELESLMGDKDALSNATAAARIVADMMQQHDRENKRLWAVVVTLVVVLSIMAGCMVWAVQNAQNVANEAMINALNTVAEIGVTQEETTTTTTVNQDTGEGNGNNIYQSGEKATYNEAASSSAETGE